MNGALRGYSHAEGEDRPNQTFPKGVKERGIAVSIGKWGL